MNEKDLKIEAGHWEIYYLHVDNSNIACFTNIFSRSQGDEIDINIIYYQVFS